MILSDFRIRQSITSLSLMMLVPFELSVLMVDPSVFLQSQQEAFENSSVSSSSVLM